MRCGVMRCAVFGIVCSLCSGVLYVVWCDLGSDLWLCAVLVIVHSGCSVCG